MSSTKNYLLNFNKSIKFSQIKKIHHRFGIIFTLPIYTELEKLQKIKLIPKNFKVLTSFAKYNCKCHNTRLTLE